MQTFSEHELKIIGRLRQQPPQTTLSIRQSCPLHSTCDPLPLFRVYKIDDDRFEAEWNGYHTAGVKQIFRFEDAGVYNEPTRP